MATTATLRRLQSMIRMQLTKYPSAGEITNNKTFAAKLPLTADLLEKRERESTFADANKFDATQEHIEHYLVLAFQLSTLAPDFSNAISTYAFNSGVPATSKGLTDHFNQQEMDIVLTNDTDVTNLREILIAKFFGFDYNTASAEDKKDIQTLRRDIAKIAHEGNPLNRYSPPPEEHTYFYFDTPPATTAHPTVGKQ